LYKYIFFQVPSEDGEKGIRCESVTLGQRCMRGQWSHRSHCRNIWREGVAGGWSAESEDLPGKKG